VTSGLHFPRGSALFCDDIRREEGGKLTLAGVYGGGMVVHGNLPVTIRQLFVHLIVEIARDSLPCPLVVKILRTDHDDPLFEMESEIKPTDQIIDDQDPFVDDADRIPGLRLTMNAQMTDVTIERPCILKARAFVGDKELRLGSLQITAAPPQQQ
jgi:hypothetical protein